MAGGSGNSKAQAFPGLEVWADPRQRDQIIGILQRLNASEGKAGVPAWSAGVDAGDHRLSNLADPAASQDAVTKAYADTHYGSKAISLALSVAGTNPINIQTLLGAGGQTFVGIHDERIVRTGDPAATLFYETDRQALYIMDAAAQNWLWAASFPAIGAYVVEAGLFSDLGSSDAGFPAWGIDTGLLYVWSGAVWHVRAGVMRGAFAARPAPFVGVDAEVIYVATDRGNQAWRLDYAANDWILLEGWGQPTEGGIGGITGGLGANDVGYRYYANDYARVYVWTGAAYTDAPGSDARFGYVDYQGGAPDLPAGWIAANGALQTASTSTGGTAPFTPNLVAGFFVRV